MRGRKDRGEGRETLEAAREKDMYGYGLKSALCGIFETLLTDIQTLIDDAMDDVNDELTEEGIDVDEAEQRTENARDSIQVEISEGLRSIMEAVLPDLLCNGESEVADDD